MLGQRVITAVVLLALLLAALAAGRWPFALLTLLAIGLAGWEWARLNGCADAGSIAGGVVVALACGAAAALGWVGATPPALWWLALALWVAGGVVALRAGPAGWPHLPQALRLAIGAVALVVAWLAFAEAHAVGVNFLLSVCALVWAADISAYFGGRAFGKRKLAPSISPGKSWAGVWSGMVGVLVLALAWSAVDARFGVDSPSLYTQLHEHVGAPATALLLVGLAAISVVGDLVESLVKRAAGRKDASALLPGHGGVLDRIDALLPVLPIALALRTL